MENFKMFCDKYGGGIVGGLVGIALAVLLFCTNLYKILKKVILDRKAKYYK